MTNGMSRCKGSVSDWGIGSKGGISGVLDDIDEVWTAHDTS